MCKNDWIFHSLYGNMHSPNEGRLHMKNNEIFSYYKNNKISAGLIRIIEAAERGEIQFTYVLRETRISDDHAVRKAVLDYLAKLGVTVMEATTNKALNSPKER